MTTAHKAAEAILSQQTADGAIAMEKPGTGESTVISYFGCFAAQGLLAVYRDTREGRYLDGARRWVYWYAKHQNADGTIYDYKGRKGVWTSTGHYDSTDSYAAVYLDLLDDLYRSSPDQAWLRKQRPSMDRAYAGIRLTMQPSGLTCATPTYPVEYTMDNVETLFGLRSLAHLASVLGDKTLQAKAKADGAKMESAIDTLLWNREASCYRIAVQPDGGKIEGLKVWYPDVMANLMPIAWLAPSPRHKELLTRLKKEFAAMIPDAITDVDTFEKTIWWAWAAKGAGDTALLNRLKDRLQRFEDVTANGANPANFGHVAMLCSSKSGR